MTPKEPVRVEVIQARFGTVTVRSDCGCGLCRKFFNRPPRPDTREAPPR